jgi:membrane-associated PAP2 superfamily phosphatase
MRILQYGVTLRLPDPWAWAVASFAGLVAWDLIGLDLPLARLMAGSGAFSLREHWTLASVLHQGARQLAWLVAMWLLAGVRWPTGWLRQLSQAARLQWLASTLLSLLLVSALKYSSRTSCPWDLSEFGGGAQYLSHWAWGRSDGGPGHCFPAGHASAAFAFLGGYFALRQTSRPRAMLGVTTVLAAGLVLGLAQQLRGAHYMSHTLWTAWCCWIVACACDSAARRGKLSPTVAARHETC